MQWWQNKFNQLIDVLEDEQILNLKLSMLQDKMNQLKRNRICDKILTNIEHSRWLT